MTLTDVRIESPCIGVCRLEPATDICLGCFRTMQEIIDWRDLNADQRAAICRTLEGRRQHLSRGSK